jgi:DNA sulfur modification protein DndB
MNNVRAPFFTINQGSKAILLTTLTADVICKISYAAVRGQSTEEGAVQRILNTGRISSIKEFAIEVGDFPNAIILNWVKQSNPLVRTNDEIHFRVEDLCAQIIDGQHRVAGLREAIKTNASVGNLELPVAIYENLSTAECANIFLSINTEQKVVPRSLVFDLYGVASEAVIDPAAVRARDIAILLNTSEESPYFENIKFPGAKIRKGGIALSTVVSAIKPLVEDNGDFKQINIAELELQGRVILNFLNALYNLYGEYWSDKRNAFLYAAGFTGALEFFRFKVIPYGNNQKSFEVSLIQDAIGLNSSNLIFQEVVKGVGGKEASKKIALLLDQAFKPTSSSPSTFKI